VAKRKSAENLSNAIDREGGRSATLPAGYATFLADLKARVRSAQLRAAVSVNRELIVLYWDIGKAIVERQKKHKWGEHVIGRLSGDLAKEFPQMARFSRHNLYRMRAFYLGYSRTGSIVAQPVRQLPVGGKTPGIRAGSEIVAQPVRQLPAAILQTLVGELNPEQPAAALTAILLGQNVFLLQKLKDSLLRLWYAHKAIEHGWSRAILTHHIESQLHQREGKSNLTVWRRGRMNLSVRGIDANLSLRSTDSFRADWLPEVNADFVPVRKELNNPPFNLSDWAGENLRQEMRWKFGMALSDVSELRDRERRH
jgi:predicted nuclease of restriction endonuclease-like (RecB) superfamily